jgi:magnesium chelatase family protein
MELRRYRGRLRGPLLDRVDLHVLVPPAGPRALAAERGEDSATVAARVVAARAAQTQRWSDLDLPFVVDLNARVPGPVLRSARWRLRAGDRRPLDRALETGALTLRGYDRALRVAWTLADLAGRARPAADDVHAALVLRSPGIAA